MKKQITSIIGLILGLFIAHSALAQTSPTDSIAPSFWDTVKGEIRLAYADYTGNTEKIDVNYGFKLNKKWDNNLLSLSAAGSYGEANGLRNQEKYEIGLFDEVNFNKVLGGYAKYGYLKDPFSGYDNLNKFGAGVLITAVDKKTISFKTRLGYEFRHEDYTGEAESMSLNTGKAGFRLKFSVMKNISFTSEVNYQHDFENSENYFADGLAAILFDVNKYIDLEMSYFLDYKNTPPENKQDLDKIFRTTLKIKF